MTISSNISTDLMNFKVFPFLGLDGFEPLSTTGRKYYIETKELLTRLRVAKYFPQAYSWMKVVYKKPEGWSMRFESLKSVVVTRKKAKALVKQSNIIKKISIASAIVSVGALCVLGISAAAGLVKSNWIAAYLRNNPGSTAEEALQAFIEHALNLNTDLVDSVLNMDL